MEPNRNDSQNKNDGGRKPEDKKPRSQKLIALVVTLALVLLFSWVYDAVSKSQYQETTFSDFLQEMENNNLSEVQIQTDRILYMTK